MRHHNYASLLGGDYERSSPAEFSATYILPLRWTRPGPLTEVTAYLAMLAQTLEVIVVDGSPRPLFNLHRDTWGDIVRHVPVDPARRGRNGKVCAVMTGIEFAGHERLVIADDDVRYDATGLRHVLELLQDNDLVRPQNYFEPLPWHARWDTGRALLNRSLGHDFPGTLGVRRSALLAADGYDADALFENLELIRTIEAAGGTCAHRRNLYVPRLPPTTAHFLSQRVRQAYDSFAQPSRLVAELSLLPLSLWLLAKRRFMALGAGVGCATVLAEVGRRRAGGRAYFPPSCSLLAPGWTIERALCIWAALWCRARRGGVVYAGVRIKKAASSRRSLRRYQPA